MHYDVKKGKRKEKEWRLLHLDCNRVTTDLLYNFMNEIKNGSFLLLFTFGVTRPKDKSIVHGLVISCGKDTSKLCEILWEIIPLKEEKNV